MKEHHLAEEKHRLETQKESTVYEGCHGWGIKCVFALMNAVTHRLAETVEQHTQSDSGRNAVGAGFSIK